MSEYSIRLELNGNSDGKIYDKLHAAMAAKGFTRYVAAGGKKYQLPHGNYWRVSTHNLDTIYTEAEAAAQSVWLDIDLMASIDVTTKFRLKEYVEPINPVIAAFLQGAKVPPRKF